MDLWVVAAAAGAGYVAKFLKKAKERDGELGVEESSGKLSSSSNFEHLGDNSSPIRKLGQKKFGGEECREEGADRAVGVINHSHGFVASELASTSGVEGETMGSYRSLEDYNVLSISCLSPRFIAKRNEENSTVGSGDIVDKSPRRIKGSIRTKVRRGYSVKAISSLDSCLEAHLYNEHNMEEYLFGTLPSSSPSTTRPLIVTDGRRVISRASSDSCSLHYNSCKEGGLYSDVKEKVMGVPLLPEIAPLEIPKKVKQKRRKELHGSFGGSNKKLFGRQFHSQGSSDRMFLFCLGITFGVLSTVVANKREVDKLNELLKETKNLVEDLHEELEMKDSLTVKVITREGSESQENNQALTSFSSAREMNESLECDIRTVDQKSDGNFDSMSKIEAELEAELERLELNISTSSRERRMSGLVEIDPDSLADIVQGELRVDMVSRVAGVESDSRRDSSGTSTTKTENANYAVSPRELSLRLHEVIQSRLEERITELETALENSQKKLHSIEPKPITSWRNYPTSEMGSSSHDSPTTREPANTIAQPLFLNLSDDALDAYKEAYEALNIRIAGTDDDSPPFTVYKSTQKEELHSSDRSVLWSQNEGGENGSESNEVVEIHYGSDDEDDNDEDEDEAEDEDEDEMRRLLIKKLVEKTRQGSPVVLNAQRMLFSMDQKSPLE